MEDNVVTNTEKLRKNLPEHFEDLQQMLQNFSNDDYNGVTNEDLGNFQNGNYLVEVKISEDGSVKYACGRDQTHLNSQKTWMEDPLNDYPNEDLEGLKNMGLDTKIIYVDWVEGKASGVKVSDSDHFMTIEEAGLSHTDVTNAGEVIDDLLEVHGDKGYIAVIIQ